jgi:pimeloyl-ACP methyl ester carboxylesterase
MSRTAYITIFGRGTPATSECYGLRAFMQSFRGEGDVAEFFAYDDPNLLTRVTQTVWGCERVILCGHSYGGAAVKWISDRWAGHAAGNPKVDLAVFFDPAPEAAHFHQFFSWQAADANLMSRWHVPLGVVRRAICLYQRNEMLVPGVLGICGVPFVPVPTVADVVCRDDSPPELSGRVRNFNVTGWGLYHCHMLGDARVQALVSRAIRESLSEGEGL